MSRGRLRAKLMAVEPEALMSKLAIVRYGLAALLMGSAAASAMSPGMPEGMAPGDVPEVAPEVWEQLLKLQLEDEKKCVLAGTVFVREMPGPEGVTISGRAKCFDGREFDFSQSKPHMKFEIRACEPTVC